MEFTRDFFYDEVRNGFYVPGIVKRAWGAELTILSEIDSRNKAPLGKRKTVLLFPPFR